MAIVKTITTTEAKEIGQAIADAWDWGYAEWYKPNYSGTYYLRFEDNTAAGTSGINVESHSGYDGTNVSFEVIVPVMNGNSVPSPCTLSFSVGAKITLHLIRTNSALLMQFYQGEIEPSENTTTVIVSYATNQYTGLREPVMSVLKVPAINSTADNINYTYIGSKDVLSGDKEWQAIGYVAGGCKISVLTPFFFHASQCTLDNVYLFTAYQPTTAYRGECTINGRRYYVCNIIAVLDE